MTSTARQRSDRAKARAQRGQENQPPQAEAASTQPQQAQRQSQAQQGQHGCSFTGAAASLSDRRPLAEQPQQPCQVSHCRGLLLILACYGAPAVCLVLHAQTPDGMPPHIIKLKAGCMVMLIRNVHRDLGLVNGARLIVRGFQPRCVDCEIAGGVHEGRRVFNPRMVFFSEGGSFMLRRRQLPLRQACAMTVNKAQGQTLSKVGLYLPNDLFCHGQLYVALSRVSSEASIVVLAKKGFHQGKLGVYTKKFVFKEALS